MKAVRLMLSVLVLLISFASNAHTTDSVALSVTKDGKKEKQLTAEEQSLFAQLEAYFQTREEQLQRQLFLSETVRQVIVYDRQGKIFHQEDIQDGIIPARAIPAGAARLMLLDGTLHFMLMR